MIQDMIAAFSITPLGVGEGVGGYVADAVRVHKGTRHALAASTPRFPTGLPSWDDAWTTVAFDVADSPDTYVIAWRQAHADAAVDLALPHLGDGDAAVEQVYPAAGVGADR